MLSSFEIPASTQKTFSHRALVPGGHGYQQHVWHAALARDCHAFTTHPGSASDRGDGTPGFWTGNATFPRQTQNGNTLLQIFSIPEDHPIQFTHAYWPLEVFDTEQRRGHWAFGRKNKGYIALWCSTKPMLCSEVLINRELRASGNKMAWVCICSGENESGDFDAFVSTPYARALVWETIRSFRSHTPFPSIGGVAPDIVPGIDWSDHWSFEQFGFPAMMVTDTAPFRYPHYHKPSDTPDKIDYARLARITKGVERVVRDIAR
jgi:hypothetical protein